MKRFPLALLLCFFTFSAFTQNSKQQYPSIDIEISDYEINQIDVNKYLDDLSDHDFNLVEIELGGVTYELELIRSGLLAENFKINTSSPSPIGNIVRPFKGTVIGDPDSKVRLSFNNDFIYGSITTGGETIMVQPLRAFDPQAPKGLFVSYDKDDVKESKHEAACKQLFDEEYHKRKEDHNHSHNHGNAESVVGLCFDVDFALASDFLMFNAYGSVAGVSNQTIGVLNDVQTDYDNEFADEVNFTVVTEFIVTSAASDPWTASTAAGTFLGSFRTWGNGGGFGVTFDVASCWTDRNFDGGTVGVAWVGAVCTNSRYNVLQDFSSTAWRLRVLQSHELGHNFGSGHDAAGSGFIMAPSVNNTTTWSGASINAIESHYLSRTCLSSCPASAAPTALYTVNIVNECAPGVVQFNDQSSGGATSWSWTFPGGTPTTSTLQNPIVSYPMAGMYNATLTASNVVGSTSYSLPVDFEIKDIPVASFTSQLIFPTTVIFANNSSSNSDTFFWDFGDGNTSTLENPTHSYIASGTFAVTLIATNNCGTSTFTEVIVIDVDPVADFTSDTQQGCVPLIVNFTDQSTNQPAQWNWMFEGGSPLVSAIPNPVIAYNTAGVYDVSLEVNNGFGTDMITKTDYITVDPDPIADFSFSVNGATVTFTDLSNFGDSWSWDFGDGNTGTMQNPIHSYGLGGTYNVTLIVTNNCGTDQISKDVIITLGPTASFTTAQSPMGCLPHTVDFMDTSGGNPTAWDWTFPGGVPASSTAQNPTVTYNGAGSFDVSLTVTNTQGNSTTTETNYVQIDDVPTVGFNFTNTGLAYNFTGAATNANTLMWDFGDGNTSVMTNPTHTYLTEGNYTVTLTATNNCGTVTDMQTVAAFVMPSAGFTQSSTSGCVPHTVSFTSNSSSNVTGWSWSFPGGTPATSTAQNPTVVYNTGGVYDVSLTVSSPAGMDTEIMTDLITINDTPTASFSHVNNFLDFTFTNTSTNATSYSWDFGDGNNSTMTSPMHSYAAEGNYVVVLTATNGCGSTTETINVGAFNLPTAGFTQSALVGCLPFTVQFTDNSSNNVTAWSWSFPGGTPATSTMQNPSVVYNAVGTYDVTLEVAAPNGIDVITNMDLISVIDVPVIDIDFNIVGNAVELINSTPGTTASWSVSDGANYVTNNPVHTFTENGNYSIDVIVTNACGSDMTTIDLSISAYPTAAFEGSVESGCAPLTVDFVSSSLLASDFNWIFDGGNPATSTDENPTVIYDTPGSYEVTLMASNGFGSDTEVRTSYITVLGPPTASYNFSQMGSAYNFTSTGSGATSYAWDFGDGNTSNLENPAHSYATTGMYTVSLTVTNACGMITYTETIDVDFTTPGISVGFSSESGCAPFTVQITDQSTNNPTSWMWTFPGGTPATSTQQNPEVTYNSAGVYTIDAVISNVDGSSSFSFIDQITVLDVPLAGFTANELNGNVDFTNISTGATSYLWDFGDGNTSIEENPSHDYTSSATYTVTLTATNSCGDHVTTMEVMVIVSSLEELETALSFVVNPNPNHGVFTVQFNEALSANAEVDIIDILGRTVKSKTALAQGTKFFTVKELRTQGTLFVRITMDGKSAIKKVVVL